MTINQCDNSSGGQSTSSRSVNQSIMDEQDIARMGWDESGSLHVCVCVSVCVSCALNFWSVRATINNGARCPGRQADRQRGVCCSSFRGRGHTSDSHSACAPCVISGILVVYLKFEALKVSPYAHSLASCSRRRRSRSRGGSRSC